MAFLQAKEGKQIEERTATEPKETIRPFKFYLAETSENQTECQPPSIANSLKDKEEK